MTIRPGTRSAYLLGALLLASAASTGCLVAGAVAAGAIVSGGAGEVKKTYPAVPADARKAAKDVLQEMKIAVQKESDVQFDGTSADNRKVRVQFRKEGDTSCVVYFKIGGSGDEKVSQQFFSKLDRRRGE